MRFRLTTKLPLSVMKPNCRRSLMTYTVYFSISWNILIETWCIISLEYNGGKLAAAWFWKKNILNTLEPFDSYNNIYIEQNSVITQKGLWHLQSLEILSTKSQNTITETAFTLPSCFYGILKIKAFKLVTNFC